MSVGNFKTFYRVLEDVLKGKQVKLRSYEGYSSLPDYDWFEHESNEIVRWANDKKYHEWTGFVKEILFNDNSHVDIIFDENKKMTKSSSDLQDHCFGWHMGDYLELL